MGFNTQGALGGAASGALAGTSVMPGWGTAIGAVGGGLLGAFTGGGKKEKKQQIPLLNPAQQRILEQLTNAANNRNAGGAFGESADYYRDLLGNNPEDFQRFAAPEQRYFNEQIIPSLSEQFAGMGSGGLSSSGFRNAAVSAGTDLSERLGALRAQLRAQGAAGLMNVGQQSLGNYTDNLLRPATMGGGAEITQGLASGLGQAVPGLLSDWIRNRNNNSTPLSSYNNQSQVGQNIYNQSQSAIRR